MFGDPRGVGDGQPFERYQCLRCGAHNPRRERPYCSVCGGRQLTPVPGPPLITRPAQRRNPPPERE